MSKSHYTLYAQQHEDGTIKVTKPVLALPEARLSESFTTPVPKPATKSASPVIDDDMGIDYVYWGGSDNEGTAFRKKLDLVPLGGIAIKKLVDMMYGNGIVYYKREDRAKGNTVERAYITEVEEFLERNKIETHWLVRQMRDYRLFLSCFGEFRFSIGGEKITNIKAFDTEEVRMDKDKKFILYSHYFPLNSANKDNWLQIPMIPEEDLETHFDSKTVKKYAYHSYFPTSGSIHYPMPPWFALSKEKGWLDVSAGVPEIISSMQRNQIILKYQINIPYSYFATRFPGWDSYSDAKKEEKIDETIKKIDTSLSDTKNLYKSISVIFQDGEMAGSGEGGKIEIIAIDDKTKNDAWIPSSNAADAQIVQGLGLHPSQLGLAPEGGKMGAGSGSDQRESYNTVITLNTIDQRIVLSPLNFISLYNNWGVVFEIDHTHHTTTNNQEDGLSPSPKTTIVEPAKSDNNG